MSPKIRVLPFDNSSKTPDLENFASTCRSSKRVIDLARQGGRSERDKLGRRRSTTLTISPSSDSRPLVYHSNHQALSTARFCRAGLLATADTCTFKPCVSPGALDNPQNPQLRHRSAACDEAAAGER